MTGGRHRPARSWRWVQGPAVAAAVTLAATGCSISADQAARPVANPPDDLFATTTAATVPDEPEPGFTLDLYFLNEADQLVVVERSRDTEATPQDAIDALLAPPLPEDLEGWELGPLVTKLVNAAYVAPPGPDGSGVVLVTVEGEELRNLADAAPDRVEQIFQQIVCTLTAMNPAIVGVQIQDANGLIKAPVADTPVDRPVGRTDFGDCVTVQPPPPPTTTRPVTTRRLPQPSTTTTVPPSTTVASAPIGASTDPA